MKTIHDLQPKEVWDIFYELTQIPRPSKKEHKAVEWAYNYGKKLGLETTKDKVGNVIIRKPATKGMENRAGLIFEAHLDMVPEKNPEVKHNFEKDPIKTRVVGNMLYATGTTLGADNGLGVAIAMAILKDKKLSHGPIEALFTVDEETGMTGAKELKAGLLKGDILINLDSETEGEICIGCAGGLDAEAVLKYKTEKVPSGYVYKEVIVKGLMGGHSGMEIYLYRGNANKIMARILLPILRDLNGRLIFISGGSKRNAIPRDARAIIAIPKANERKATAVISKVTKEAKYEHRYSDKELEVKTKSLKIKDPAIAKSTALNLVKAIYACPNGIYRKTDELPGIPSEVETSNNMAIVEQGKSTIKVHALMRSFTDSNKYDLAEAFRALFELAGATCSFSGAYSGWELDPNSPILKVAVDVYKQLYKKTPRVYKVHAGLECGILGAIYKHWDMVSVGPTIMSPHSPDERCEIDSVGKCYKYVQELVKHAPIKSKKK